eukprot:CAMPEP_0196582476 /NCGR_PEP_ID=MMETSP1081-20130531/39034_1 /TAXON_ID=36882 /ORGANISM="Pyramimonas amylifera, Strain CCMP720" /LENGTH=267 /DNA_ID=CAMNT_0041903039 /DNA_START=32 /DNA_END=831 /DNA_ORIENTATION=-
MPGERVEAEGEPVHLRDRTWASSEVSAGLAAARAELGVVAEVGDEDDRAAVPYHLQVNVDMYSENNRRARFALKQSLHVGEAVERWRHLVGGQGPEGACLPVSRRVYMRLSGAVFLAVLGEDAGADTLEENWEADSGGQSQLAPDQFFDAIFELADIWCQTVEESEYVEFLNRTLWDTYQILSQLAPLDCEGGLGEGGKEAGGRARQEVSGRRDAREVAEELKQLGFGGKADAGHQVEVEHELEEHAATTEEAEFVRKFMSKMELQG